MWLVVGLGNPGKKYQLTRHNVGFMAIDFFLSSIGRPPEKKEHQSLTCSFTMEDQKILLAKPQTFMNLSGMAVQALCHYYKISHNRLIVLHDDIEYPFKQLKIHRGRGHGGHNGIRDIHQKLSTNDYCRIRIGVGRSKTSDHKELNDHVLSNFSKEEQKVLPGLLEKTTDGVEGLIFEGLEKTANLLNSKI